MTTAEFLKSLPKDPEEALAQIEGALRWADEIPPQDRQALVTARLEWQRQKERQCHS